MAPDPNKPLFWLVSAQRCTEELQNTKTFFKKSLNCDDKLVFIT